MTTPKQVRFHQPLNRQPWNIPQHRREAFRNDLQRHASDAASAGTTTEQMLQAEANPMVLEALCRSGIAGDISIFGTTSGSASMEPADTGATLGDILGPSLLKEKPKEKVYYPMFSIACTACCGQHVLSGYQSDTYTPELLIGGIKKTYIAQEKHNEAGRIRNQAAVKAYRNLPDNLRASLEFGHPYPVIQPEYPAAMIVFTWNSHTWDKTSTDFAEFVKARGLGECVITNGVVNPNSRNTIKSMIWNINREGYEAYAKDLEVE